MSRRKVTKKKFPAPDCTYNSYLVTILISRILKSGKKTLAQTIVNETFDVLFHVRMIIHYGLFCRVFQ